MATATSRPPGLRGYDARWSDDTGTALVGPDGARILVAPEPLISDNFEGVADGALLGRTPLIGPVWQVTGASPPTIVDEKFSSPAGVGYALQALSEQPEWMSCDVSFSGTDATLLRMTMAMSKDAIGDVGDNLAHFNFGPRFFDLTVVNNASDVFVQILNGAWRREMAMDGTVYRIYFGIRGERAIVVGPNGEHAEVIDARLALAAGPSLYWQPNYGATQTAFVHRVSAAKRNDDLVRMAPIDSAISTNGQNLRGRSQQHTEVEVGEGTTDHPSVIFGPKVGRTVLRSAVSVGASTIPVTTWLYPTAVVTLSPGLAAQEEVTVLSCAGSNGAFTATLTGTTANSHLAGAEVISIWAAASRPRIQYNWGTKYFEAVNAPLVVQASVAANQVGMMAGQYGWGLWLGTDLGTGVYRHAAGIVRIRDYAITAGVTLIPIAAAGVANNTVFIDSGTGLLSFKDATGTLKTVNLT